MIDTYDKQTGDGNWLRQSIQILQGAIESVQRTKSQMAEENRGADAGRDQTATAQKDMQSRVAG
jgi:hypothetical protein